MKYAKNMKGGAGEGGGGGGVTWQPIARGALVINVHSWTKC